MNRLIILLIFFISTALSISFSQDDTDARIKEIETIASNLTQFFNSDPIFIEKQMGFSLIKHFHPVSEVSYDIKRTESIVSPLQGSVNIKIRMKFNTLGGGYPTLQQCLADTDFIELESFSVFTFTYAYERGHWTFKFIKTSMEYNVYNMYMNDVENRHWNNAGKRAANF